MGVKPPDVGRLWCALPAQVADVGKFLILRRRSVIAVQDTVNAHAADVHLLSYLVGRQTLGPQLVDLIPVDADLTTMVDIDTFGFGFGDTLSLSLLDDVALKLREGPHHLKL